MAKTKNLTIAGTRFICIHKIEHHDPEIYQNCARKPNWDDIYDVHFTGDKVYSSQDLCNPETNVGLAIGLGAASAVDRPSNSEALYYEGEIIWMVSWTDLFGSSGSRAPCCH